MSKRFKSSAVVALSLALGFMTLVLAGSTDATLASDKPDTPNLSGKWTYNASQSDNARQKIEEAEQNRRVQASQRDPGAGYPRGGGLPGTDYPGSGGMGRGGIGMGGIGGGGMGRGGMGRGPGGRVAQDSGLNSDDMDTLATDPKALTIDQNEKQISITDDADHTENLYPDGKKHKGDDASGDKTGIKTRWNGSRLVCQSKLGHSGKLTETYELSPDAKQLYVTSELSSAHLSAPLIIRRVYDNSATHAP